MTSVFTRIMAKKVESGKSWDEICREAHIGLSSWMTGLPTCSPRDSELKKIAPVLNTTFEWLKYGKE